jgi:hypothetical protein
VTHRSIQGKGGHPGPDLPGASAWGAAGGGRRDGWATVDEGRPPSTPRQARADTVGGKAYSDQFIQLVNSTHPP